MTEATKTAWITGAGSGVGRATALALGALGWRVVLSGRRADALAETARLVRDAGGDPVELPLDVGAGDPAAAAAVVGGRLDALVLAAGLNHPERAWADQGMGAFEAIVQTNLLGAVRVIDAALPALRRASGVVVIVSSIAGWRPSPGAGVAYSASKTALAPVVRTINDQEGASGVRATHLCPGDIDSDFLQQRPSVPDAAARAVMLSPADVADAALYAITAPPHVRIDELVLSPLSQR
ncbi:MAG: SDR family NAD(P)-dependent oxidoreductase [Microbacteriaceae bacterium]